jgi:hypothetical protein
MTHDEAIIARQLGRPPRGFLKVEAYCQYGYPKVIQVYPLLREQEAFEPFPTLFWLTCPIIVEQISRIEEQGVILGLEQELAGNPDLQRRYEADHQRYAHERFALLKPEDRDLLEERGLIATLRDRGIAGIQDLRYVKCLHAHYAHHLARGSVIGRLLSERHVIAECTANNVYCDGLASK